MAIKWHFLVLSLYICSRMPLAIRMLSEVLRPDRKELWKGLIREQIKNRPKSMHKNLGDYFVNRITKTYRPKVFDGFRMGILKNQYDMRRIDRRWESTSREKVMHNLKEMGMCEIPELFEKYRI